MSHIECQLDWLNICVVMVWCGVCVMIVMSEQVGQVGMLKTCSSSLPRMTGSEQLSMPRWGSLEVICSFLGI